MNRRQCFVIASSLLLAGCGTLGGSTITTSPRNWDAYADQTVTVQGNAGNSRLGPIVRLDDGGYIALRTAKPWSIDALGRPVLVTGKVVSGEGFRAEKFVLEADKISLVAPPSADEAAEAARAARPDAADESDAAKAPEIRLPTPPVIKAAP